MQVVTAIERSEFHGRAPHPGPGACDRVGILFLVIPMGVKIPAPFDYAQGRPCPEQDAGQGRGTRPDYRFLDRVMASRASLSAVRRRSVSRLSQSCLPLARASSSLTLPFLKYIRVGMRVKPFCWVWPISLRNSSLWTRSLRVRRGAWLKMLPCS